MIPNFGKKNSFIFQFTKDNNLTQYSFRLASVQTKFGFKNRVGHEIRGKITGFKLAEGDDFWFELLGASKNQGFKKSQESSFQCFNRPKCNDN